MTVMDTMPSPTRLLLFAVLIAGACFSLQARAQAGPPLITNDPDTPGDGKWEINLAIAGAIRHDTWDLSAPDIDINYGLGERVQLSMHLPWLHRSSDDGAWQSGTGPVELAVRWRFIDEEKSGFSMAVQPHWSSAWSIAARRRGLVSPNDELALPIQVSRHFGKAVAGIEVGRNFISNEADEWQAGLFWSHDCLASVQCLAEVNSIWSPGSGPRAIVNVGARKTMGEHLVLLGSLGRQPSGADGSGQTVFYVGVQLLR